MKTWPHAPLHLFNERGSYMVTGATLNKLHVFENDQQLDYIQDLLIELAEKYQWRLEAWAIFSNHYHFIAQSPENPSSLKKFITHFHATSARYINEIQQMPGRKVWFQYWDSQLTFQSSYLARLNYVMQNPVRHKLVNCASLYKWCSSSWFQKNANKSYYETVTSMKIDNVHVLDDF